MADNDGRNTNPRGLLIALAVVVLILGGAVVLIRELGASARLQDCVLAGRSNCASIQSPGR